jgi:hypothetical protein
MQVVDASYGVNINAGIFGNLVDVPKNMLIIR